MEPMRLRLSGAGQAGKTMLAYDMVLEDIASGKQLPFVDISLHASVQDFGRVKVTATFYVDELNIQTVKE